MTHTKNRFKFIAIPTLLLITGASMWWFFLRGPDAPEGVLTLSG